MTATVNAVASGSKAQTTSPGVALNALAAAINGIDYSPTTNQNGALGFIVNSVAVGGVMSVVIADATAIDPVSSVGASGSGWVAIVKLKGITSIVGTVNATALTISITDPGYDTAGNVTSVARTITGVAHLRRQHPNGNSKMISTDGTDLTIYVTFDTRVYAGTTIVSASIGSTFYPSCVASDAPTKTNLSARAYTKPVFGWTSHQQMVATGSTYAVEGEAFHRHARNAQQVACVKYSVSDGTNTSADVLVSAPTTSTVITKCNVPEVWAGSVDMSGMTQAALCTVNAKVYPWIGDSTAVLNIATGGVAWPTASPCTLLRVVCDRTGGYGGGYAYVKVGAAAGTVSATPATAAGDPYPTIHGALAALKVWNNANRGHNDIGGGTIRFMDTAGADTTHNISVSAVDSPGIGCCILEKDPASSAVITITPSASLKQLPANIMWRRVTLKTAVLAYNFAGYNHAREIISFDEVILDNSAAQTFLTYYDHPRIYNCTTVGTNIDMLNNGTAAKACQILAGTDSTATTGWFGSGTTPLMMIGNKSCTPSIQAPIASDGFDGMIVHNNTFSGGLSFVINQTASPKSLSVYGVAVVQNLIETTLTRASLAFNAFADSDISTILNYIDMHNTAVGARCSRMYNDVAATRIAPNGMQKLGVSKYSIYDNYNIKSDTFNTGVGGTGNWEYMYSVENTGNVSLFGDVSVASGTTPHNDNTPAPYLGPAWLPSSEPNLQTTLGVAGTMAQFTNYTVTPAAGNVIGGDYRPTSGATYIKNRVPVGLAVLSKDISGSARRNDGTGAAGAYESA